MTTKVTALPRRADLQPGESLPSLLLRLARLNFYEPPGLLSQVCVEGLDEHSARAASHPTSPTLFSRVSALTRIEPVGLYAATAHRFAVVLTPPDISIPTIELADAGKVGLQPQAIANRHIRPRNAAQYCPRCIEGAAYHRLIWMPVAVAACLEHRC